MTAAVPEPEEAHGVQLGGPDDLQRAWRMMAGGSSEIVGILMNIARYSPQDNVRVQAGLGLLKMGGFGGSDVVPVRIVPQQFDPTVDHGTGKESTAKRLEDRWAKLREADQPVVTDDDEVIDAVIVEDDEA